MKGLGSVALVTLVALAAAGCAGGRAPLGAKGGGAATDARTATPRSLPSGAKGGSPSPILGMPSPVASCLGKPTGGPMLLLGQALYEVTDPVHPTLLCHVSNTITHLYSADSFGYLRRTGTEGTEVVLHSISSGSEQVVAGWPLTMLDGPAARAGAWSVDGNEAATLVTVSDANGNQVVQVWLFTQPETALLYSFPLPLTDCICRFGLPDPVLAFSPDGQYLVSGWPIGKAASPLEIYRVADRTLVVTLNVEDTLAVWSQTGDRLYASGRSGSVATWAPDDRLLYLADTPVWPYMAGLSPDGTEIAYTAYADPANSANLRVYVFDIRTQSARMLIDQSRSEVTFVKDGWVWYLEEAPCSNCPGQTGPADKVFAMELSTGVEQQVVFAPQQSPVELRSGWTPGQFWPNS